LKLSEVYNGKLAFSWIIVQADKDEATHEDRVRQHAELSPRIVTAIITYMADSVLSLMDVELATLTPYVMLAGWKDYTVATSSA
jgi:hypothetical protein